MKKLKIMQEIVGNLCIICSIALLTIQVLDWYNPFMDFTGHAKFLISLLCISSALISLYTLFGKQGHIRQEKKRK